MVRRSERPDIRRVYRKAWADRTATGDTADEVLLRRLRLNSMWLAPEDEHARAMVLGWWRRGVPPWRLDLEITLAGQLLKTVGRACWSVARVILDPGVAGEPVAFDPLLSPAELSDLLEANCDVEDGDGEVEVWFDVRDQAEPGAMVMLGDDALGRTVLPVADWSRLLAASESDLFADGTLEVVETDGLLVVESLSYEGLDED